jgi:hypothetical protein
MIPMSRYLVAKYWMHCFVGSQESLTAWVLDIRQRKLVCGFLDYYGRLELLDSRELADLQEDVEFNVYDSIDKGTIDETYEGYLVLMNELPDWARGAVPA